MDADRAKPVENGTKKPSETHSSESLTFAGSPGLPLFTNLDVNKRYKSDNLDLPLHYSTIFYMKRDPRYDNEKPYFFNIPVDASWLSTVQQTNVCYTRKKIAISDIRGHENMFSLDTYGFQLGKLVTGLSYDDFAVTDLVVSRYYEEVRNYIKRHTGAVDVLPFDFQV